MHIKATLIILVAGLVGSSLAVTACVGDSTVTVNDGGADAANDSTVDAQGKDTGADSPAEACAKTCDGGCVAPDDPAFGCSATSCAPCSALAHVTQPACSGGACAIGACDPAYDDLDRDASDGCELPNPLAYNPSKLALWLKADKGVVTGDAGVTSWQNLAPTADGGAGAVLATGHPAMDTSSWPSLPGVKSVSFVSGDSFDADFSGMGAANYTMFAATARYGDQVICVMGTKTPASGYPPVSCPSQKGGAFEVCYSSNTNVDLEVWCNNVSVGVPANTSSGYQPSILSMWYDGSLNYGAVDANSNNNNGQFPSTLSGTLNPGRLGGGYFAPAYTGLVGEVIIYSTLLSGPDHTALQSYLKTKWKTP